MAQSAVSPCSGVFHQDRQRGTVIADIRSVISESAPVSRDDLSTLCKYVNGMGSDSCQHLLVRILRLCRIKMLSIHTDFAITICLQPFVTTDIEPFWRQHQECFPVFFKQFPDGYLLLVMELRCFLFVAGKQLLVILFYLIEMRDWNKQVCTVIINLTLHISFLPAGIGITEAHPEVIMGTETGEKFRFMDRIADPPPNTGCIIKDQ